MAYIPQFDPKRDLPNLEVVSEKRSTVLIGTTGTAAITGTTLDGPVFIRAKYPGRHGNFLTVESSLSTTQTLSFAATLEIATIDKIKFSGASGSLIGAIAGRQPARLITVGFYTTSTAVVKDELLGTLGTFNIGGYFRSSSVCFGLKDFSLTNTGTDTITFLAGYPYETYQYPAPSLGSLAHLDIQAISQDVNSKSQLVTLIDPPGELTDVRDTRTAADVFYPDFKFPEFNKTKLTGADGPGSSPNGIKTGPSRTILLLMSVENENGSMRNVEQLLEWKGASTTDGSWKKTN